MSTDLKEKTCCFTGHRDLPQNQISKIRERLNSLITGLIENGVDRFLSGGCYGFDTEAALTVLDLKQKYPNIRLIFVIPYKEQAKNWSEQDKAIYEDIKNRCDECVYTSENYRQGCMHIRNRYLVDNSRYCICYLRKKKGGTAYTVKYATKFMLKIYNTNDV